MLVWLKFTRHFISFLGQLRKFFISWKQYVPQPIQRYRYRAAIIRWFFIPIIRRALCTHHHRHHHDTVHGEGMWPIVTLPGLGGKLALELCYLLHYQCIIILIHTGNILSWRRSTWSDRCNPSLSDMRITNPSKTATSSYTKFSLCNLRVTLQYNHKKSLLLCIAAFLLFWSL